MRKKNSRPKQADLIKRVQEWLGKYMQPNRMDQTLIADKVKPHVHSIEGVAAKAKGHSESLAFYTGKPVTTKRGHIHEYQGVMVQGNKETHTIEGVTGPAIARGNDHYHHVTGRTTVYDNHHHVYNVDTSGATRRPKKRR